MALKLVRRPPTISLSQIQTEIRDFCFVLEWLGVQASSKWTGKMVRVGIRGRTFEVDFDVIGEAFV